MYRLMQCLVIFVNLYDETSNNVCISQVVFDECLCAISSIRNLPDLPRTLALSFMAL